MQGVELPDGRTAAPARPKRDDGVVTGFEVKAGRDVQQRDARGLVALRDTLGDHFSAGIILTTGDTSYGLDDRIHVVPVHRLWTPTPPPAPRTRRA